MTDTVSIRPTGAAPADEPRAIDQITRHLTTTRFEDLPAADVELAKWRVLDVIGCAFGGASIDGNAELLDLLQTWGGAPQSTVIGHGGKLPVHHAALINTMMVRANDFEVMTFWHDGVRQPAHNSASTVPTALAVAESRGLGGRDVLTATMLGDDLAGRVALSSDWTFYLGPDGLGTLVPWGTTAVAGRLLGLDAEQLRHAFGLMVNMMAGTVQDYWDGSHAIKLVQGTASHTGVMATELASRGWTGLSDPLFAEYGYYKVFAQGCKNPGILTEGLGEHYFGEVVFKPYPSGLPTHLPIDCALALHHEHGVRAEDVDEVVIGLTPPNLKNYYAKPYEIRDWPHGDAAFSFQYTACTALLHGAMSIEHFTEDMIRSPQINELIARSRIEPISAGRDGGAEVTVRLRDGRELTVWKPYAKGDEANPMTEDDILAKYRHQVEVTGIVSAATAERVIETVLRLDQLDDLSELTALLSDASAGATR
ncbi:hypothetical protein GCM10011490_26510 [Pseudoclavibacter endophyticus]|uniref:MmgE/PrpD family protein n=1 Tax=Pseudoclavibacter endophyticus TaxID=1778590 RepID=A0A6H9WP77_9MICO|nr:MmgE/PrpD family protein [Pseudoclavibacter endophyticus]KAB1646909.1 MmgE/PrpD family protein [Pseudoclavibacter endophyticus]GGA74519.1 hypothetical protein GCM10011490_26510 [Pseudoclavibacter endophyticus]